MSRIKKEDSYGIQVFDDVYQLFHFKQATSNSQLTDSYDYTAMFSGKQIIKGGTYSEIIEYIKENKIICWRGATPIKLPDFCYGIPEQTLQSKLEEEIFKRESIVFAKVSGKVAYIVTNPKTLEKLFNEITPDSGYIMCYGKITYRSIEIVESLHITENEFIVI